MEHQQKKNCWYYFKVLDRLIFGVPEVAVLLAVNVIPSIFLIVLNLVYVLRNVRYYQTMRFSMQETVINGEEVWEVDFASSSSVDKEKVKAGRRERAFQLPLAKAIRSKLSLDRSSIGAYLGSRRRAMRRREALPRCDGSSVIVVCYVGSSRRACSSNGGGHPP